MACRRVLPALFLLASMAGPAAAQQLRVLDLDGRTIDPLQRRSNIHTTVFVFASTDCPIANRYAPELRRLFEAFAERGVAFWLVFVNPTESPATIREHTQKFDYPMTAIRDPHHDLVKRLGVTVTPESAVLDRQERTLYRGRIDDRYVDFGVERPLPTQRDLDEALTAITAGKPPRVPTTRAIGCYIADFRPVTFASDIAPIVFDKCATCHRPKGPAPFSLLTYADVRQRASQIVAVTQSRFMPPWKAVSDAGSFVGQKPLTDDERALLRRWVDGGALEGEPRDLPRPPTFAEGWQLGAPDLVVTMPEPYTLAGEGSDVFRIFVIPLPVSMPRHVTGIEFRPGNPRVVHHANIRLDHTPTARDLDARDPAPGYDGLMPRSAVYPEGHFLGWTPGQVAPLVPARMAWRLEPGTDLVLQLHMQPSGAPEIVRPSIGLFFSDTPSTETPTILRLGSQGIDIPAGTTRFEITDSYALPVDVELHALQPHAHYRLREARGTATLPNGTTTSLIQINDWDFRWQHVYRFSKPVSLPKGTRVAMRYVYDNSADNPRNPQLPPQRVNWGQRSFDEMGDLWFQFSTRTESDRAALSTPVQHKMTAEDIVGYETMLRANPTDAEMHDDVAVLYLSLGRATEAITHFQASARIKPQLAAAHFNLATALSVAGRLDEAVDEYRQALALRPGYAGAHNNLGSVLDAQGKRAEALTHFREAVRLDDSNVQAQRNLAWHLATAVPVDARATAEEAIKAAERAALLTAHRDAQVLDALAAAYAAAGAFDRAIEVAERGIALTRDESLAREMRKRLELYRQRRVYTR